MRLLLLGALLSWLGRTSGLVLPSLNLKSVGTQKVIQQDVVSGNNDQSHKIVEALKNAKVIPDVLDDFDPRVAINVTYPSKDKNVDLGNKLKPKWVHSSPDLFVEILPTKTIDFKATYVFAMTDPDATSRSHPIKGQFCHWLVGNITFEESSSPSALASSPSLKLNIPFNSEDAEVSELVSYYSPAPPPKTGFHRYIFTLLVMTNKTQEPLKKPKERIHWGYGEIGAGVREWATENELEVIGGNFFYAQNKKQ